MTALFAHGCVVGDDGYCHMCYPDGPPDLKEAEREGEAVMGDPEWLKSLERARLDKQPDSYIRYDNYDKAEREWERQIACLEADVRRLTQIGAQAEAEVERSHKAILALTAEVERLRAILSDYNSVKDALETIATEVCPTAGEDEVAAVRRVVYAELRNRGRAEQAEARLREVVEALERIEHEAAADQCEIPFYAYGDNEAGCRMGQAHGWIRDEARAALAAAQPEVTVSVAAVFPGAADEQDDRAAAQPEEEK